MFTALKAWTLQADEFENLDTYFDPRVNHNYQLNRNPTLRSAIAGLKKIFTPDFFTWYYGTRDEGHPLIARIWKEAAADPDIHILTLLGALIYEGEIVHEDEDGESDIHTGIHMEMEFPRRYSIDYIDYGFYNESFDWEMSSDNEIVAAALACLRERSRPDFSEADLSRAIRMPDCIVIRAPLMHSMFRYHFGRIDYMKTYQYDNGGQLDDGATTFSHVLAHLEELHKIQVQGAFDHHNGPKICWVLPQSGTDRSRLYNVLTYSTNVAQLIPGHLREDNELSSNLYGIELEVSSAVEPRQVIDAPEKMYCACKQDSSISGSKPWKYEIVSAPCTIKVHKKAWGQILDKVGYQNFDVTRATNNGMHVHVDMNAFRNRNGVQDGGHQRQFLWFFCNPVNRSFMELVSERDEQTARTYAAPPNFPRHSTLSTLHRNLTSYLVPPFRGIVAFKQDRNSRQYVTIEVRLFKGIVSLASIWKNLEFVDSVFHFTTKTAFQSNTLDNYLQYLNSLPRNKYSTLREFLSRLDLDDLLGIGRLKQLLWGINDAEKVKYICTKQSIQIKPSQLEVLNSLVEGAKFALSKRGELVVMETNRSRVYDLDSVLHGKLNRRKGADNVSHPRS